MKLSILVTGMEIAHDYIFVHMFEKLKQRGGKKEHNVEETLGYVVGVILGSEHQCIKGGVMWSF